MIQTERSFEEKVLYMNADEKKVIEQIVINTVKKLMEEKNKHHHNHDHDHAHDHNHDHAH